GISKAMGQTSRELIVQIMLSNIPTILAGTLIGVLFAEAAGSGIIKTAFSLFAVKSIPFNISFIYMIITIMGIILVAVLTSGFAGLKVNGLKPVEMITED
ncbi:MAG: FtsX-like permease family protein, partial [Eubacterium sp.]|nr:FtsX-like permease family protein [Eubacterium sp.]